MTVSLTSTCLFLNPPSIFIGSEYWVGGKGTPIWGEVAGCWYACVSYPGSGMSLISYAMHLFIATPFIITSLITSSSAWKQVEWP